MNNRRPLLARATVALTGGLILATVGGAAAFADTEYDNNDVDISVTIPETDEPGVLAMTVAADSTTLTESGTTAVIRQFAGALPSVTITDTRDADEIPDGAGWYVLGSASDFIGSTGQPSIGADHLGWTPRLLDGGDSGIVTEGDQVDTVLDTGPNAVGLIDQELLALAADSQAVNSEGSWTVDADLFLKTEPDVAAGDYTSTLTLSLFE